MSNTNLEDIVRPRGGRLATKESLKAASKIHAVEKAEEIAKRIKDASALEGALTQKIEFERDFAAMYRGTFPHGFGPGRGHKRDAASDISFSASEKWCRAHGFVLRTVQRWCELLDESIFIRKKNEILKKCWELAELWQAANFMSESVEWYTPVRYIEAVREVLGQIDLDPASNEQANTTIRAEQFFTKEQDGLDLDWHGRVFMNPPYGKTEDRSSLAGAFCRKAVDEVECGNVTACIILINSLHSQTWQAPLYKHTVCFVDHRIQFISGDGDINKSPTFQNIFVYLGDDIQRFATVFSRLGYVMRCINS